MLDLPKDKIETPLRLSTELELANRLALAPLAGTTNAAFRPLAARYGAALAVTELVSARGLIYPGGLERARPYLHLNPGEVVAIQLFGSEPSDFSQAIKILLNHSEYGYAQMIDLNLGCPVPKVVKTGAGSALLKTAELATEIIAASVEAAAEFHKPVSVKIRLSWSGEAGTASKIIEGAKAAGAKMLTVHGRSREQFYAGKADWEGIAELAKKYGQDFAAFYGNGDIDSESRAISAMQIPGISGLMIGRAAKGAPWIFATLRGCPEPSRQEKIEVIREHYAGMQKLFGPDRASREFRSALLAYIRDFPGAANFRRAASGISSAEELDSFLYKLANI
ncbi:MAG: tRNA-dihydrouridine synthase [Eubacteriales bacterium]|nr:tRNA-dihydrouridine synthase [Eubacteriales bacterium]